MKRLLFALVTLVCGPAHADWQYTRWGMTPEQVVSASAGAARLVGDANSRANGRGAMGSYSADGLLFEVRFQFKNNGLSTVSLAPARPDQNGAISSALMARYGRPISKEPGPYVDKLRWRDESAGNLVELIDIRISNSLAIVYTPLSAGRGL